MFSNLISRFDSVSHLSTLSRSKQLHYLPDADLHQKLAIPDLSDTKHGVHAINLVVDKVKQLFLNENASPLFEVQRKSPISTIADEFDNLYFPQDGLNRLPIYTRYLSESTALRTHTPSIVPTIHRELKTRDFSDYVAICPEIFYIEDLTIINQVPYADLPFHVRNRLVMQEDDKNIVFSVLFRYHEKNLTGHEINEYANKIFQIVHCRDGGYSYPSSKNKFNK